MPMPPPLSRPPAGGEGGGRGGEGGAAEATLGRGMAHHITWIGARAAACNNRRVKCRQPKRKVPTTEEESADNRGVKCRQPRRTIHGEVETGGQRVAGVLEGGSRLVRLDEVLPGAQHITSRAQHINNKLWTRHQSKSPAGHTAHHQHRVDKTPKHITSRAQGGKDTKKRTRQVKKREGARGQGWWVTG